ncbi:hypothetical protein FRC11_013313, partial [Ceratobasidium sp. 423]
YEKVLDDDVGSTADVVGVDAGAVDEGVVDSGALVVVGAGSCVVEVVGTGCALVVTGTELVLDEILGVPAGGPV